MKKQYSIETSNIIFAKYGAVITKSALSKYYEIWASINNYFYLIAPNSIPNHVQLNQLCRPVSAFFALFKIMKKQYNKETSSIILRHYDDIRISLTTGKYSRMWMPVDMFVFQEVALQNSLTLEFNLNHSLRNLLYFIEPPTFVYYT